MAKLTGYFLGVQHGKGVNKDGKPYDFCLIRLLAKDDGFESAKANFKASGYKEVTYGLTRDAFQLLQGREVQPDKLQLVELITETQLNDWGKLEAQVIGIK